MCQSVTGNALKLDTEKRNPHPPAGVYSTAFAKNCFINTHTQNQSAEIGFENGVRNERLPTSISRRAGVDGKERKMRVCEKKRQNGKLFVAENITTRRCTHAAIYIRLGDGILWRTEPIDINFDLL
jgi:hypothetical protein